MANIATCNLHDSMRCFSRSYRTLLHKLCVIAATGTNCITDSAVLANCSLAYTRSCTGAEGSALCPLLVNKALFLSDSDCSALLVAIFVSYCRHCTAEK